MENFRNNPKNSDIEGINSLLELCDLLEGRTSVEIDKIFRHNGFKKSSNYGQRAGIMKPTSALIKTIDNKIIIATSLNDFYFSGEYSLDILVNDINHPTNQELKQIKYYVTDLALNMGKRFSEFWEQNSHNLAIEVDQNVKLSMVNKIKKLFGI
ncbi:MAG: hypothetical protein JWM56_1384 [Candidatus Peribacteria bacterium]|nr:hypothetical protein [Candidatus Peribacteria bacterium]